MNHYEFGYDQGTNQITCTKGGIPLDWIPPIPAIGLTRMAASAKPVFYADLVKDMQAGPSVINSVGVIIANFAGQYLGVPGQPGYVDTDSIQTIRTRPLTNLKDAMKTAMTTQGTYVEKINIPKQSTSGVNPKTYSYANYVYYDSGESPSAICINPNVIHLIDSAYCLDPASGTSHVHKDYRNYSFTVDRSITEGLFGFPSYYSFTTIPNDVPENCQVTYGLNTGNLDVPFNMMDGNGKNTDFNSQYSNAVKNIYIMQYSAVVDRQNEIIKKLVIKESGDCAQIWSIICELIIQAEESGVADKVEVFKRLRAETLLITTDSVVFSRGIPFCNVSNNGSMAGVVSGSFTQQYFTHGSPDYPLAYTTQMDVEKQRIKDQNDVNRGIFTEMIRFFTTKNSYPYFYRLVEIPGSRRPKKELTYNRDLYNPDCIDGICNGQIAEIDRLNAQIDGINPTVTSASVTNADNLKTTLELQFLHMESFACRLYFSIDPRGNYIVHDYLHSEIQSCLKVPESMKASANFDAVGDGGDDYEPSPRDVANYFKHNLDQVLDTLDREVRKPDSDGFFRINSQSFDEFKFSEDREEQIDTTIKPEENDEDFSYYDCLVAYMILQKGFTEGYARKDQGGRIYILPASFLEKYDTFIDEYKRERVVDGDRHKDVRNLIISIAYETDYEEGQIGDYTNCDIKVRQIGVRCLRVILDNFLHRKYDMRMHRPVGFGVDSSVMQLDSSNSSSSSSNSSSSSSNSSNSNNRSSFFNENSEDMDSDPDSATTQMNSSPQRNNMGNQNSYETPPPKRKSRWPFSSSYEEVSTTDDNIDSQDPEGVSVTNFSRIQNNSKSLDNSKYSSEVMDSNDNSESAVAKQEPKQSLFDKIKNGFKWWEGGKRRTMKVKKYLKNNRKKTIKKSKKTIKKPIRKNKKTRKYKS